MSKQKILEWYRKHPDHITSGMSDRVAHLETLLDSYREEIVASVPCEKDKREVSQYTTGWNTPCNKVEAWKQKQGKEVEG